MSACKHAILLQTILITLAGLLTGCARNENKAVSDGTQHAESQDTTPVYQKRVASPEKAVIRHEATTLPEQLVELTDEQAEAFSKKWGWLELDSLEKLSDSAAHLLAQHKGRLSLTGLTALTDEQAQALATHEGPLALDGVTNLSDKQAEALARCEGPLSLLGITTLSEAAAAMLIANKAIALPTQFRNQPVSSR